MCSPPLSPLAGLAVVRHRRRAGRVHLRERGVQLPRRARRARDGRRHPDAVRGQPRGRRDPDREQRHQGRAEGLLPQLGCWPACLTVVPLEHRRRDAIAAGEGHVPKARVAFFAGPLLAKTLARGFCGSAALEVQAGRSSLSLAYEQGDEPFHGERHFFCMRVTVAIL